MMSYKCFDVDFSVRRILTILYLCLALGVTLVAANVCNTTEAEICFNDLILYEGIGFPMYGENEDKLTETCDVIDTSFKCLESFRTQCSNTEDCDEKCQNTIDTFTSFSKNTGLRSLESDLCTPDNPLRKTYLENYECIESNADAYGACHNDSQLSQEHMQYINEVDKMITARCCFFSWYQDCFVNVTRDTCGNNATFFISISLHKLMGHIVDALCAGDSVRCDRPPLPHDGDYDDNDIPDMKNDNIPDGKTSDIPDEKTSDIPDVENNDIDTHDPNSAADFHSCTALAIVIAFSYIALSKYML